MRFINRIILFICLSWMTITAHAAPQCGLNMPYGASPISRQIYQLHMAAFYVCCVIAVLVFGVLIYSLIKFRKSKGAVSAHFHEHLGIEILWTTIPFLILVALAVPATIVLQHIHNTDNAALTIKITGYQWKWKYEYLDQGIRFFSNLSTTQEQINNKAPKDPWYLLEVDNPVVVPVNTKVRLLVTADDVIHSWWVPELGVKQDAIPGYINENWIYIDRPGTYRGQCGELCGINHGFMPIVVKAVSQAEFNQWVTDHRPAAMRAAEAANLKPQTAEQLLTAGKAGYEKSCVMCHQPDGKGLPPSFPALRKSRVVTGSSDANIAFVLTGVPGTAMQAFGNQMDDKTLAEIISYTRSAWGNSDIITRRKYSVLVQPEDVKKVRDMHKAQQ
ncbi:MAG TPA: cytochrome c oxidase subunit II [Gammaproteobacteria bacterium]|nr:cytochrome c oxidase subunit II [Gammaproteobacteria bacterium]